MERLLEITITSITMDILLNITKVTKCTLFMHMTSNIRKVITTPTLNHLKYEKTKWRRKAE